MSTREEFEDRRRRWAGGMAKDASLQRRALRLLVPAIRRRWIHQTTWFGEPVLQLPQDLFAIQEIVFKTRPKFIVELGIAWAGSLLFYATLMEALGGRRVIGVDVYVPDDLRRRVAASSRVSRRITLIHASSTERATVDRIRRLTKDCGELLVHLDSAHTHDHVLQELRLYAPLIGPGHYLICGDTHVERVPSGTHGKKPYGPGNNPKTALEEFLRGPEGRAWEIDRQYDKYLLSLNPGGYLVRRRPRR